LRGLHTASNLPNNRTQSALGQAIRAAKPPGKAELGKANPNKKRLSIDKHSTQELAFINLLGKTAAAFGTLG